MSNLSKENKIILILAGFPFHAVRAFMESMGHSYAGSPGTPTIHSLKETARELLENVFSGESKEISGGCFTASIEEGVVNLAFNWEGAISTDLKGRNIYGSI